MPAGPHDAAKITMDETVKFVRAGWNPPVVTMVTAMMVFVEQGDATVTVDSQEQPVNNARVVSMAPTAQPVTVHRWDHVTMVLKALVGVSVNRVGSEIDARLNLVPSQRSVVSVILRPLVYPRLAVSVNLDSRETVLSASQNHLLTFALSIMEAVTLMQTVTRQG